VTNLRDRLMAEGFKIVQRGKRYFVADADAAIIEPAP
jgi:hypothetical protein